MLDPRRMYDLLTHTMSQGLQALAPIVFGLTWFDRAHDRRAVAGAGWGLAASIPATAVAAYLFMATSRQAVWEAALAAAACAIAVAFVGRVRRGIRTPAPLDTIAARGVFAAAAMLLVVRQTMEIAIVSVAALQLRALDPLIALSGGAAIAAVSALAWVLVARRVGDAALHRAAGTFGVLFVAQTALYAFHESAEARLLPWSEVLHAATEPYGPDGAYGRYASVLLLVGPLCAAAISRRAIDVLRAQKPRIAAALRPAWAAMSMLALAGIVSISVTRVDRAPAPPPAAAAAGRDAGLIAATPHLLFRHTAVDANYSRLAITPLDARTPADRAAAAFACERVAFAAGRGICLAADRGVFTAYKALLFDRSLAPTRTLPLPGTPSRARVSPDGRVGAITVFVAGQTHGYAGTSFSTRTTILDMESGDELADLEQFSTWKDGARVKAADVNFWGVTFARNSNVFYATLRTAAGAGSPKTYLVRGDLALRKLTVLRENVECPSLSPDNHLIAFKKRVGPDRDPWRVYILDVATLADRPLAQENRSIDDQIEWLDDGHVLYGAPRASAPASHDVWIAPIDGSAPPRVFLPEAESPIVVR